VSFSDSPFFSVLRANLHHLGQRQQLIAENIANASTPGYMPRDTDEKAFSKALTAATKARSTHGLAMAATEAGHMGFTSTSGLKSISSKVIDAPDSESTIDGNAVVLEDEMLKQSQTRSDYETSIALYQKGIQLLRMAAKAPGR
jgi:flagellar basal-body rod protein FlgB